MRSFYFSGGPSTGLIKHRNDQQKKLSILTERKFLSKFFFHNRELLGLKFSTEVAKSKFFFPVEKNQRGFSQSQSFTEALPTDFPLNVRM